MKRPCQVCEGTGRVTAHQAGADSAHLRRVVHCPACNTCRPFPILTLQKGDAA